ncbi:hypothetical protein [Chryseobacterium elymi]|nr:hypothetical protein [Chryseobacterium elymi]
MPKFLLTVFSFIILCSAHAQKPKVVVLGVGHSTQLINFNQQPAAIRAFINKVDPAAICIERSPEEFTRNDFYEFTYEQQYVVVPYAKAVMKTLHPIDWLPADMDSDLAFGIRNLEVPRFIRGKSGFLGFTVFSDESDFEDGLYFADSPEYGKRIEKWYAQHPEKMSLDFPRRLFLYRTFLQAKRIEKVLENYSEKDTILVVIGSFHKNDIEKNLAENGYAIIQPSSFGEISMQDINRNFKSEDAYAILSFNLLGMQSNINKLNPKIINHAFDYLEKTTSAEKEFFRIKYDLYLSKMSSKQAIGHYQKLLSITDDTTVFTWNGVKDKMRIDSYFDPFGNLSLKKRIRLEIAREFHKMGNEKMYKKEIDNISEGMNDYKKQMLMVYVQKYLM